MLKRVKKRKPLRRPKKPLHSRVEQELKGDEFEVIGSIPKGRAYQWVAFEVLGDAEIVAKQFATMKAGGWKSVPARRHPKMPKDRKGRIVFGGQVLMERSGAKSKKERDREQKSALDMVGDRQRFIEASNASPSQSLPPVIDIDSAIQQCKSLGEQHYAEFDLRVGLVLTQGELETSCFLGLDPSEYARRKFLMRGDILRVVYCSNAKPRDNFRVLEFITLKAESE